MPHSKHQLAIGTAYHHLRLYDIKKGRRPTLSVDIGETPIRALHFLASAQKESLTKLAYSDTVGHVGIFDTTTQKVSRQFKGIPGAVTDIQSLEGKPWILTVGMDRFLRVLDASNGKCLRKVYLKQRLSQILVCGEKEWLQEMESLALESKGKHSLDDDEEDEELWDQLKTVQEDGMISHQKKKKFKSN